MVTAELAACLPVLALLIAFAMSAVSTVDQRARLQDAAAAAARAYARGDPGHAGALAAAMAPGVEIVASSAGNDITVTASKRVTLVPGLPTITITARAVAALEPGVVP